MTEKRARDENLTELAEEAMADKQEEVGSESRAQELWDIPTEPDKDLAAQQEEM